METSKLILNQLLTIGGVATKNNLYSDAARTEDGMFVQINRYFKRFLKDGLVREMPTITRVRNKRQETFFYITGKGASYINRRDELKTRDPKSPNNVMHESMKFDIALSFVRNYPDFDFTIRYDEPINGVRPDIVIRMKHRYEHLSYHFLVEIERKKTADKVFDKVKKYETALKNIDYKSYGLKSSAKILIVYADTKFDGFLRPLEYSRLPYYKEEIALMEKRAKKIAEMSAEHEDRYRFIPFSSFNRIDKPVWLTNKGFKVSII